MAPWGGYSAAQRGEFSQQFPARLFTASYVANPHHGVVAHSAMESSSYFNGTQQYAYEAQAPYYAHEGYANAGTIRRPPGQLAPPGFHEAGGVHAPQGANAGQLMSSGLPTGPPHAFQSSVNPPHRFSPPGFHVPGSVHPPQGENAGQSMSFGLPTGPPHAFQRSMNPPRQFAPPGFHAPGGAHPPQGETAGQSMSFGLPTGIPHGFQPSINPQYAVNVPSVSYPSHSTATSQTQQMLASLLADVSDFESAPPIVPSQTPSGRCPSQGSQSDLDRSPSSFSPYSGHTPISNLEAFRTPSRSLSRHSRQSAPYDRP
jgi:hypothetical protein